MPIPIKVPLLPYEKLLLDRYWTRLEPWHSLSDNEATEAAPLVFTHWMWCLKVFIDYHLVASDEEWEPYIQGDRTKIWNVYQTRLGGQWNDSTVVYRSRKEAIFLENPNFHADFLSIADREEGEPRPIQSTQDENDWKTITKLKYFFDSCNTALKNRAQTRSTPLKSVSREYNLLEKLPWTGSLDEYLESEFNYHDRTAFEIWSLLRACATLQRRKSEHWGAIQQALHDHDFYQKYIRIGHFYVARSDIDEHIQAELDAGELEWDEKFMSSKATHDPLSWLEFIEWSKLEFCSTVDGKPAFKWLEEDAAARFEYHLRTEEEVFAYCVASQLTFEGYLKDGSVLFVATPLAESKLLEDIGNYWLKWNDCAICRDPKSNEWMLLETIPGIRYRNLWASQDQTAARKFFRNYVDDHQFGRPQLLTDVLGIPDFDPEYENLLHVIPFEEIVYVDPQPLGGGSRGIVYKGKWRCPRRINMLHEEDLDVALKLMRNESEKDHRQFLQEMDSTYTALKGSALRSPEFHGITTTPLNILDSPMPFLQSNSLVLVTELASEGPLMKYLERCLQGTQDDWATIFSVAGDIAVALWEMHTHIIHRDLHDGNILVTKRSYSLDPNVRDGFEALIADLSEGKNILRTAESTQIYYGNREFWAPEVKQSHHYSTASDMYAVGQIIRIMIEAKFDADVKYQGKSSMEVPVCLLLLAFKCLRSDPSSRVTAEQMSRMLEAYDMKYADETTDYLTMSFKGDMSQITENVWDNADILCDLLELEEMMESDDGADIPMEDGEYLEYPNDGLDEYGIPI